MIAASGHKAMRFAHQMLVVTGYVGAYLFLGTFTSLVASIFGVLAVSFLLAGGAGVIFALVLPSIYVLYVLPIGLVLSVPVTFGVLPLLAILLKRRPAIHMLSSTLGGGISGLLPVQLWMNAVHARPETRVAFLMVGFAAGVIAGIIYATLVRDARDLRS